MRDALTDEGERSLLELAEENNAMLKELLGHMRKITSEEYIQAEDIKDMTQNVIANLIAEEVGPILRDMVRNIIKDMKI